MPKYKLIVIEDGGYERSLYNIGSFKDEEELERWAKENKGELARAEEEASDA